VTSPAPDLSVLIVTHQVRAPAADCLHSLFTGGGLRGLDAEVIVVDNASDDGTAQMIAAEFPAVRLIVNGENAGFARGNNQAFAIARGRNVLLLNPDTIVPDGALAACVAFLDARPASVGGMTCRVESPDGSLQHECARRLPTPWSEACRALLLDRLFANLDWFNRERFVGWNKRDARAVPAALGAFLLLKSEAVRALPGGLLDENFFLMYEDVDLCKRLGDAGRALWYWPGARIVHLGGQSTRQRPILTYAASHASALVYFHKHHSRAVPFVRAALRAGMEIKIGLLRLRSLRRPNDEWTARHLAMARAARTALRGSPAAHAAPAAS